MLNHFYYLSIGIYVLIVLTIDVKGIPIRISMQNHVDALHQTLEKNQFKYCISTRVKDIFITRFHQCLCIGVRSNLDSTSNSNTNMQNLLFKELLLLYKTNAFDYSLSHELMGFYYYVLNMDKNPYYTSSCEDADFEYIPLLPLIHRTGLQSHTECSAGGECHHQSLNGSKFGVGSGSSGCDMRHVINSIIEYQHYREHFDSVKSNNSTSIGMAKHPQPFTMTSTFNLKTMIAHGFTMDESLKRRGSHYELVSRFIENTYLGHYERIVQCADVLRRPWKYVIEMPYIVHSPGSGTTYANPKSDGEGNLKHLKEFLNINSKIRYSNSDFNNPNPTPNPDFNPMVTVGRFKYMFYYTGDMELWGPGRVCSVTTSLYEIAYPHRLDTHIRHVDEKQSWKSNSNSNSSLRYSVRDSQELRFDMGSSLFCLIPTGNSYSSSLFFQALAHRCIPVVISDWYALPYKWYVPYEDFIIRISEQDFKINPNAALDSIRKYYVECNRCFEEIANMWTQIDLWRELLLFPNPVRIDIESSSPPAYAPELPNPMLLMLVEMSTVHKQLKYRQNPQTVGHIKNIPTEYSGSDYPSYPALESIMADKEGIPSDRKNKHSVQAVGSERGSKQERERDFLVGLSDRLVSLTALSVLCISPFAHDCIGYVRPLPIYIFNPLTQLPILSHNLDRRSYMCQHLPGLIGKYKIVYFMQCVRVLWSNFNGKTHLKLYQKLSAYEKGYVNQFHNITRSVSNGNKLNNNSSNSNGSDGTKIHDYYPTISKEQYNTVHSLSS